MLKTILFIGLMLLVVSCTPATSATPASDTQAVPTVSVEISATSPKQESSPETPTPAAKKVSVPTGTATECLPLLEPENETAYAGGKIINFKWADVPDAKYYTLLLISPDGLQNKYKTTETSSTQDIKTAPKGTNYKWSVQAYGAKDKVLCSSDIFILTMLPAGSKVPIKLTVTAGTGVAVGLGTPSSGTPTSILPPLGSTLGPTSTLEPTDTPNPTVIAPPTFPATPMPTVIVPPEVTATPPPMSTVEPTEIIPPTPPAEPTDTPDVLPSQPQPTDPPPTDPPAPAPPAAAPTGSLGMFDSRVGFLY